MKLIINNKTVKISIETALHTPLVSVDGRLTTMTCDEALLLSAALKLAVDSIREDEQRSLLDDSLGKYKTILVKRSS